MCSCYRLQKRPPIHRVLENFLVFRNHVLDANDDLSVKWML